MSELSSEFNLLDLTYQRLLLITQETHGLNIMPLQHLTGGKSGAILYLVSVSWPNQPVVQHFVLKLDKLTEWNRGELSEISRHRQALAESPEEFSRTHLAKIAFEPVESEGLISFFYTIAGSSLQNCRPLTAYAQQRQLRILFETVGASMLFDWQKSVEFEKIHPQKLIEHWLGYRINSDRGNIKEFYEQACNISIDTGGFIVQDQSLPNPFFYARNLEAWGDARPLDAVKGFLHGDLNTNNVLASFSLNGEGLEEHFIIDFANFELDGFLLYDHLYLEFSYLIQQINRVPFQRLVDFITLLAEKGLPKFEDVPAELSGIYAAVRGTREAIYKWVLRNHPTLTDDLWGQFWLAAVAVGLNFVNKNGLTNEERLASLIFAASHLKRYIKYFGLRMPDYAVELKLTSPQLPDNVKEIWQSLFLACYDFDDEGRLYFLVIGPQRGSDLELLTSIGRVGWGVVLDFDACTQEEGVYKYASEELKNRRSLHIVTSEDDITVSLKRTTYWYAAQGLAGRAGTLPEEDNWLKWNKKYYQHLQQFLLKIASSAELPVTVIILWDDFEYVRTTCEFIYRAFGDRVEFMITVPTTDHLTSIINTYKARTFPINSREFAIGIRSLMTAPAAATDYVLLPSSGESFAALSPEDVNWIEEELTLVHLGVGIHAEANRQVRRDFLLGSKISWFELSLNSDVERDKTPTVRRQVLIDLEKRLASRVNLFHFPGAGGTTIALRLAWELHKEYPTVLINSISPQTLERFRKIYSYTGKSILAVVEAANILSDTLNILYNQIESEHLPVVLLTVGRRFQGFEKDMERSFYVRERLDDGEANRFAIIYSQEEPSRRLELQRLAQDDSLSRLRVPFFFGLTAFGEDFIRLQPYVSSHLQDMEDMERKIMCYLGLAYRYAQKSIPAQMLKSIIGLSNSRPVLLERVLKPERLKLLVKEDYGEWRPSHFLIGTEIIEQIIAGNSPRQNWRQNLSLWAIQFIEDLSKSDATTFVIALMKQLFVARDSEDVFIEIEEKANFSRLIQHIGNPEGQLSVLQKLVELFPAEAHFVAHLARFRSAQHEHQRALEDASTAVRLSPNDDVLHHIKGTVLKNWAYSLIRQVDIDLKKKKVIFDDQLNKIDELVEQAETEFMTTRALSPDNEYGYVTHVQLLTRLVEFGFRKSGKAKMQAFLTDHSSTKYQEMVERAETILDQVTRMRAGRGLSNIIESCENEIDLFYGNYSDVLQSWNSMLEKRDIYKPPVRRNLVRAYLSRMDRSWDNLSTKDLRRIYDLMEENLLEEPNDERNIRLWFNAARRVPSVSIDTAIERLTYLYAINNPIDAIYYLYIMHTLKAIEGSDIAKSKAEGFIKQSQIMARHKPRGGFSFEWLGKGIELTRLIHFSRLGEFKDDIGFYENTEILARVRGKIIKAHKPEAGYIELASGLQAFFVPQRRHKDATNFGSQDINKDVDFFLGFSYEGLRAWSVDFVK